jgi:hypothetical protein
MPWPAHIPETYLRCTWPGSQSRRPAPQRAGTASLARLRYTPGMSAASRRAETSAGVRQLEPGDQPPAAPSPPAPPRREARNELKPPAAFRIAARRTQLRRPRPGAVSDLDPDDALPGPDRHRDRLPRSTRPAVPDAVAEDLADQQGSRVSARVPGAEYLRDERAGGTRPLRPPGERHTLPDRQPSHHRTRPSPAAPPPGNQPGSGRTQGNARSAPPSTSSRHNGPSRTLVRGSSVVAAPVRGRPCKADGPAHRSLAP